jgi:hypothetical protein
MNFTRKRGSKGSQSYSRRVGAAGATRYENLLCGVLSESIEGSRRPEKSTKHRSSIDSYKETVDLQRSILGGEKLASRPEMPTTL